MDEHCEESGGKGDEKCFNPYDDCHSFPLSLVMLVPFFFFSTLFFTYIFMHHLHENDLGSEHSLDTKLVL